ncbi:hypothetical protein [Providencia huaxiensis]|uniref:hypothetical protein n=1 Tax=Providencia huaxiensis TaxID=2027290 RepID=UPI001B385F89|nr:hypothetical protein [Providencia huaxiensis]MBQ0535553.1 hypothetical protein [Providencia huaxiensis]MBQ0590174.1 hypothetical protein [Providencia huaxiensis]MDI7240884.1 hypothetical protein [Providencia huaxiensis]
MGAEKSCYGKIDYSRSGIDLTNEIIDYCSSYRLIDSADILLKDRFHSNISKVSVQVDAKKYYKKIGDINKSLHGFNSQDFCDGIRDVIIKQAKTLRPNDNKDYSSLIKKSKAINTKNHSLCEAISLKVKNKSIDEKSIKKIDEILKNAKKTMSNEEFKSTLLEAQVLALSCRSKTVYEMINKVLAPYIETKDQYQYSVGSNTQLVQQNAETSRPDKEKLPGSQGNIAVISEETMIQNEVSDKTKKAGTLEQGLASNVYNSDLSNQELKKIVPIESNSINNESIEKMEHCKGRVDKLNIAVVTDKINSMVNGLSIRKNKLSQPEPSEKEPKFQKILASHTIEEAIKIKVPFNGISDKSLSLIESKIKARFNKLKSSETPYLFEKEMFDAQKILKKYDNKLVCEKINNIINKFLDRNELYIRENKVPMDRIWCAINSVSSLQDITPRKYSEFKMAIIDYLKKEPIEDIFESSSELIRKVSRYTHKNIADKVNNFINVYSMDRVKELKGNEKFSVASKIELLEPEKNRDPEELMKDMSLKKIISHVFSRMINNIRRLFSKN